MQVSQIARFFYEVASFYTVSCIDKELFSVSNVGVGCLNLFVVHDRLGVSDIVTVIETPILELELCFVLK